ncbi:lytic transglycosylase [Mycobacterium sp. GA-1999]|nr:lytic transglycosylase [Mycobacterium sp. IS-1556]KUH88429.1 lytic transglycosylase [Mycobacterium sp. GA-0227b]KUH89633.1 lytic transglycosylase [Mycobacterium sp. GA-1999]
MNARLDAARTVAAAGIAVILFAPVGCSTPDRPEASSTTTAAPARPLPTPAADAPRRELASDPARIADDLVADERVLRDPSSSEALMTAAAHRQQAAYRALGRHPEWDPIVRPRIPPELLQIYDHNVNARRELGVMSRPKDTLPAWRIVPPTPADELMGYYRQAESEFGVGWNFLAAINLIETAFGRVAGVSTAGAQGPMQFMPSTFAAYGAGGDILSPRDSIMAAGRYLAANGFATDRDYALYRYNNSNNYVRAVSDYAAVLAADPAAFAGYHRWEVYYLSTAGDVLLPVGYNETSPIPVATYLASSAKSSPDVQISEQSAQILERLLTVRNGAAGAAAPEMTDTISRQFLDTPYGADTLVGSASEPEKLVVELSRVDCFTYADYVEALKRAGNREEFIAALTEVRYRDGVVSFPNRKHFFTDWAAGTPPIATDITTSLSPNAVQVQKNLNQKDSGGVYLPGLPVVPRTVSYIPSAQVDGGVLSQLNTGDYIGSYAEDGGLDVTHVGIFIDAPNGPVVRNASSLDADEKVVDTPLQDYLRNVPGVVILRPVR